MKKNKDFELIINRPHQMTRSRKLADAGLTLIFWLLLLYMWQPLISMIAWIFKIRIFYNHMIILGGFKELAELAFVYTLIIILLGGTLLVWAKVNQFRFRGKEKRKFIKNVAVEDEAERYDLNAQTLAQWKHLKMCEIHLSELGVISTINKDESEST